MESFDKFKHQVFIRLMVVVVVLLVGLPVLYWLCYYQLSMKNNSTALVLFGYGLIGSFVIAKITSDYLTKPLKMLSQAVLHVSPDGRGVAAPTLDDLSLGREIITTLTTHIYALSTTAQNVSASLKSTKIDYRTNLVADCLPLPLIIVDHEQNINFANKAALTYIGGTEADVINHNLYQVIDMSFESKDTFDKWLKDSSVNATTATKIWEHVRLNLANESKQVLQFDLAAYYNRAQSSPFEILLLMFDRTADYSRDDESISFISLAVHELRAPLTLLRGYIEALEEEMGNNLTPANSEFLRRMDATGQQLATFMNNVLNVARIEDDQFAIHLKEEVWPTIVESAVDDMLLRAKMKGVEIETKIAPNLPKVGIDKVSIYEVITNLLDNAIKYSDQSKKVVLSTGLNKDGLVETAIQDFGVGIPVGIVGNLFDKYYRNHRTRQEIGGTGLGLYLSKTIIEAHGGNIWVRSKEGRGSVFSFTVLPYDKLSTQDKMNDMTRIAHGWIKNHSLYRR
jgi:signal transduction histidine kinase